MHSWHSSLMVAMVAWVAFECNRCGHPSLALWSLVGGPKEFAKPRPFADVQSSLRVQVSFPFLPGPSLLLGKVFFFWLAWLSQAGQKKIVAKLQRHCFCENRWRMARRMVRRFDLASHSFAVQPIYLRAGVVVEKVGKLFQSRVSQESLSGRHEVLVTSFPVRTQTCLNETKLFQQHTFFWA